MSNFNFRDFDQKNQNTNVALGGCFEKLTIFDLSPWKFSCNTAQKMKFSIKSAGNCGFGHIYWRNPQ